MPEQFDITAEFKQVSQHFAKTPALQDITCTIPIGKITGLVGPDAAGKTTFIRLLAGLLKPSQGQVMVFGQNAMQVGGGSLPGVGYMPQHFGLYEDLSVIDNMELYAELRQLTAQDKQYTFAKLFHFTRLEPFAKRLAGKLSGGMKQKLGLACALLGEPRLLLLDEPGVGVDPLSRRELWAMVQELCGTGMTILWSTAYIEEAERCPHVLLLNAGQLLYTGDPANFTRQAADSCYLAKPSSGTSIREALIYWSTQPQLADVSGQGQKIRLVFKPKAMPPSAINLIPTPPRLEDAYMQSLGVATTMVSPFTDYPSIPLSPEPVIEARNLWKRFGSFVAAKDIKFTVQPGKIFGLLGPNGAGKSTTFRMLCGLLKPSQGECFVAGVDLLHAGSTARSLLGYMAQKFSLYEDLTIKQNINLCSALYGLSKELTQERSALLLTALGLSNLEHKQAKDLPLGQKQRLALICATLHGPKALFLDEPTSGVDPPTRREFWRHITTLTQKGVAVLVTTHFMEEAEYCDDISLIYQGQSIATGSPDSLKAQFATPAQPDPTLEDAFIAAITQYHGQEVEHA